MLSIFDILVFLLLPNKFSLQAFDPYKSYSQLLLPPGPFGPDSVGLDRFNKGPYVCVSDGRILKHNGNEFQDFAYLSPNRTKQNCDGVRDINLGPKCGRPMGFTFDPFTEDMYVVDAYDGLFRVGPNGGLATPLVTSVNGTPFTLLNGIDFDQFRNVLYLTDASLTFTFKDLLQGKPFPTRDSTGRLLEYNITTGQVRVLLEGLFGPIGPAVSADSTFVLYSSSTTHQVFKYWLVGPKAGTTEALLSLPGFPLIIKRAPASGSFWVPVNVILKPQPLVVNPYAYNFDSNGQVLLIKDLSEEYPNIQVNMVQEYRSLLESQLYIGSGIISYVGIYRTG